MKTAYIEPRGSEWIITNTEGMKLFGMSFSTEQKATQFAKNKGYKVVVFS